MSIQECAGCGSRIKERWLLFAMDRYWHNQCLQCNICHAVLADLGSSCFSKQGMVLCRNDYMRWEYMFRYKKKKSKSKISNDTVEYHVQFWLFCFLCFILTKKKIIIIRQVNVICTQRDPYDIAEWQNEKFSCCSNYAIVYFLLLFIDHEF